MVALPLRLRLRIRQAWRTAISFSSLVNDSLFAAEIRHFGLRSCQGFAVFLSPADENSNSAGILGGNARCFRDTDWLEVQYTWLPLGSFDL